MNIWLSIKQKIFIFILLLFLVLNLSPLYAHFVSAQIITSDLENQAINAENNTGDKAKWSWEKALENFKDAIKTAGSKALSSALRNALNKIAYDTATYIGSGGRGQNPLFITEGWGTYLGNIGDQAAGEFVEKLGRDKNFFGEFNLCQPNLDVRMKIGLGLVEQERPSAPACTFTEMKNNWENELSRPDFLYRLKSMFDPSGNELLQAFTMHANLIGTKDLEKELGLQERTETKGWIDVTNIAGDRVGTPGSAERELQAANDLYMGHIGDFTGDALVDASNVFLNQLAITAFQTAMRKLGEGGGHSTSPYDWSSLTDFNAGPSYGGISGTKERLSGVIAPNFSVRGDYDILSELTMCPDPTKAGPTNCVITDKFRQAIIEKLTLAEAIEGGYLDGGMVFGFKGSEIQPAYNEGIPYRSMVILRKFRIIPVGWELAAQYIKDSKNDIYNLLEVMNCYDPTDKYGEYSTSGPSAECLPLVGLVDPAWVLKAPLNYCKREGPGPEIIHESISGEKENSKISISRNDEYCADEQACIDENDDGSCNVFGYCTEEKRKWNFGADSCEPKYNTCQTFLASDGSKISYLENTLDLANCDIGNAGCAEYFTSSSAYDSATNNVSWNTGATDPVMYFDRDASECPDGAEGCTQLIRTKSGIGVNLLPNSSFEDIDPSGNLQYWGVMGSSIQDLTDSLDGYASLQLPVGNTATSSTVGPKGYMATGETFSLSFYSKNCDSGSEVTLGSISSFATSSMESFDDWSFHSVTNSFSFATNVIDISFNTPTSGCLIDSIKLERGTSPTRYSRYMDTGVIYSKLIPNYLYSDCYVSPGTSDYRLLASRPLECDNFSRLCNEEEVGCSLYTSVKDKIDVPAKVTAEDYCPDVCVGYDAYLQTESSFDSEQIQNFIPNTAKTCSAQQSGCDEFTNLDKINEGGEALEYYTSLKQCIKPDGTCEEYYTWEGSKQTGYQLKVFSLQRDVTDINGDGDTVEPAALTDDSLLCNKTIFYASSTSPLYNPDCREYYATTGEPYYHLSSQIISCSDNCHPYRRTDDNVVKHLDGTSYTNAECSPLIANPNIEAGWDTDNSYCVECIGGGEWNSDHNACIYMAIPNEGQTCSASQNGCREYGGNSGRNTKNIINSSFEGTTQGWTGEGTTAIGVSNESLMVGGNSLYVTSASYEIGYTIGTNVRQNDAYVLKFIAKGDGTTPLLSFRIENSNGDSTYFSGTTTLQADAWGMYEINLLSLDHEIDSGEKIIIQGNDSFYIDDIILTNIRDRYYLIKNSWVMPEVNGVDICNYDIVNNYDSPLYSLSCEQYTDADNQYYSLRQFSSLCQESAVGCEVMIDTHNSDNFDSEDIPNALANPSTPDTVSADNYIYAVYNEDKLCDSENKGCQRMGKASTYEGQKLTQDFYIKNNPDGYETTICSATDTECKEWSTDDGLSYFKDPGDQICEWKQVPGVVGTEWAWYKKPVKRCDDNANLTIDAGVENSICINATDCGLIGGVCSEDVDCGVNGDGVAINTCYNGTCMNSCILDDNAYSCSIDELKTFGEGGYGNRAPQPTNDIDGYWAGVCPAEQSSCTELIDPMSSFSSELLFNPDFSQDIAGTGVADGWAVVSPGGLGAQSIFLKPFTLYTLTVENINHVHLHSTDAIYRLDGTNNITSVNDIDLNSTAMNDRYSAIFYTSNVGNFRVDIDVSNNSSISNSSKVSLREAVVSYKIDKLLEENECNGLVNAEEGCVLFNKREINGGSLNGLNWDADETAYDENGLTPVSGSTINNDSNTLLQVSPDRDCRKWLACKSYIKDENDNDLCYDIGLCDALDDNGGCYNFIVDSVSPVEQTYNLGDTQFLNRSGYSKASYFGTEDSFKETNGYYKFGEMNQIGQSTKTVNGTFEEFSTEGYPISWANALNSSVAWNKNHFRVISNPVDAQEIGVGKGPEGRAYLSMGPGYEVATGFISVNPSTTYVLSGFINTLKINSGAANINVIQYGSGDNDLHIPVSASLNYGRPWKKVVKEFTTNSNTVKIKIHLNSSGTPDSNFYFDDIQIKPALNSSDVVGEDGYTTQECRLYPQDDSLSCEYIEDSGMRQKGWYGYCLEHDSYPGNEDACLLWWPIDNVQGEGYTNDNNGGYLGKVPVYYCTDGQETETRIKVSVPNPNGVPPVANDINHNPPIPKNNTTDGIVHITSNSHVYSQIDIDDLYTFPPSDPTILAIKNLSFINVKTGTTITIPDINSDISGSAQEGGKKGNGISWNYDSSTHILYLDGWSWGWGDCKGPALNQCGGTIQINEMYFDEVRRYCSELSQVVTLTGENKYWSGRVYEGSDFSIDCNTDPDFLAYSSMYGVTSSCVYETNDSPFGSMKPRSDNPSILSNPYEWDGKLNEYGVQPIYFSRENDEPSAGQEFEDLSDSRPSASRLFAQSYGTWGWNGGSFFCEDGVTACSSDHNQCPGGTCAEACSANINGFIISNNPDEFGMTLSTNTGTNLAACRSAFSYTNPTNPSLNTNSVSVYNSNNTCVNSFCTLSETACSVNSDCDLQITYAYDHCVNGSADNNYCDQPQDCPNSTCLSTGVDYGHYELIPNQGWKVPDTTCGPGPVYSRPTPATLNSAYCAIPPILDQQNITINNYNSGVILNNAEIANLKFTSKVDSNQEPLTGYSIYWDGSIDFRYDKTIVSGIEINSKPNTDNPHSVYHLYGYWDLLQKSLETASPIACGDNCLADGHCLDYTGPYCVVTPLLQIKDNWGWCDNGNNTSLCPDTGLTQYLGEVVVIMESAN